MPNCDFYALYADFVDVVAFVFSNPGWILIELASRPDHDLREFRSVEQFTEAYPETNASIHMHLYADSVGGTVSKRRINLKPGAIPGATFRYAAEGWGLIQLYFGGVRNGRLSNSHTNHNSEKRAMAWASVSKGDRVDAWNWQEVNRISNRLNRHIRALAVHKASSRPVLKRAFEASSAGVVALT